MKQLTTPFERKWYEIIVLKDISKGFNCVVVVFFQIKTSILNHYIPRECNHSNAKIHFLKMITHICDICITVYVYLCLDSMKIWIVCTLFTLDTLIGFICQTLHMEFPAPSNLHLLQSNPSITSLFGPSKKWRYSEYDIIEGFLSYKHKNMFYEKAKYKFIFAMYHVNRNVNRY